MAVSDVGKVMVEEDNLLYETSLLIDMSLAGLAKADDIKLPLNTECHCK